MPGRLPSGDPARVAPAKTKAKARRKLRIRILTVSGGLSSDAHPCARGVVTLCRFRSSASKSKMVSSVQRIVSSRPRARNIAPKNPITSIMPIVHWASSIVQWTIPSANEPKPGARRLPESACNLVGCCALGLTLNGDNVVGSRSIDVGNKGPAKKPGGPTVDRLSEAVRFPELRIDGGDPPKAKVCGAMSQQYGDGDHGNVSAPQKFVQLVGCRDPNARTGPQTGVGARPRPAPSKR